MTSIAFTYTSNGPILNLKATETGPDNEMQRAVVTMATELGSDSTFPDNGTSLPIECQEGSMASPGYMQHAVNFAAADASRFMMSTDAYKNPDALTKLQATLRPDGHGNGILQILATCADGSQRGTLAVI